MRGRTGLCPRLRWGSLQHPADALARLRALLLKGDEGMGEKVKGRGGKGMGEEVVPPLCGRKLRPWSYLLRLSFVGALALMVDAAEVGHDDRDRQRDDQNTAQRTHAANHLADHRTRHHVTIPAPPPQPPASQRAVSTVNKRPK